MSELTLTKPVLDPVVQQFLEELKAQDGRPIYELSPTEARNILLKVQDIPVKKLPADIEDIKIPVGPNEETRLRIVRPQGNKTVLPAIMYFHGGGWILGDTETHDRLIREIANGAQAAVIFVDYDRSPESKYLIILEEVYEATKYISEHASTFNVDVSKLAVMGDSVGGNMVAAVTMLAKERSGPKINFQVMFYPVTAADFSTESYKNFADGYWLSARAMKWFWDAYLPDEQARKKAIASPILASIEQLEGLPPVLLITNECDVLRDEGEMYARKLMHAGVQTTAIRLVGTIHDSVMLNALAETPATRIAIELANEQLRQSFAKK